MFLTTYLISKLFGECTTDMHAYAHLFIVIESVLFVVFVVKVLIVCPNKQARLISQIGKQRLKKEGSSPGLVELVGMD